MRNSRRAFFWIAILGLAITLVVILQRRGDDLAVPEAAASAFQSIDATRTTQSVVPADVSAASIADSGDEVVMKCAQTINDAADFVSMERKAASPVQVRESDGDELVADAQRGLAGSRDPEHFLTALLLTSLTEPSVEPPERRALNDAAAQVKLLDLVDRATRSGSKLLAWHALRVCVAAKPSCSIAHLEQRLLEVDKQNAEAWAMVATLRYKRGDIAGALAAMQGAAHASTSTWYWTETSAMIERSLASQTSIPRTYGLGMATGLATVAFPPDAGANAKVCQVESVSSRAWAEACLGFARLRAEHNETNLAQSLAYITRSDVLKATGDTEGAAEAAEELELLRAERRAGGVEINVLRSALSSSSPERFYAQLEAIREFGEFEGYRKFLRQDLPPLLERAGLLERDGARECVARFFAGTRVAAAGQRAQVADELDISMRSPSEGGHRTVRIRPDGKITVPFTRGTRTADGTMVRTEHEIVAAGKTTEQLQREIAMILSEYYRSPQVILTLLSSGSREQLRLEFDNAQREAAERRSKSR